MQNLTEFILPKAEKAQIGIRLTTDHRGKLDYITKLKNVTITSFFEQAIDYFYKLYKVE